MMTGPVTSRALEQACAALARLNDGDASPLPAGMAMGELFARRVTHVDAVLEAAWGHAGLDDAPAALLAVGGYGRGELFPHSDIDVLVLVEPGHEDALRTRIEGFIGSLWDIGLVLGHGTRPLDACLDLAAEDVSVVTNLLEARLLTGEASLRDRLHAALHEGPIWPARDFFLAKKAEQTARHQKYDHSGYKIEPNVKESPGGLRDWHMMRWLASRVLGDAGLDALVEHGLLTRAEADDLAARVDFLARVRYMLHRLTGRHEDRLLLIHQKALAAEFGHVSEDGNAGVEAFMQRYFRAVMGIERMNDLLLQQFAERLFPPTGEAVPLNPRFNLREGLIETRHAQIFMLAPSAMLEIFLLMQQHPEIRGIRASTLRQLRSHVPLMRGEAKNNPHARALFMAILRQPQGVNEALKRMNRLGLLAAYLPAFEQITGRMQFDLFHLYTVDEHTLFVIRNLRRFALPEFRDESPLAHELFVAFDKPELLILAALFHDIAKGRGGEHEILGAEDALAFCRQHAIPGDDAELIAWLVREHLTLSFIAQRRDIEDPDVIREFAARVESRRRLDALYMLTVADIRATNPTLWTEWRAALLRSLYRKTRAKLEAEREAFDIAALREQAFALLAGQQADLDAAARLWDTLPPRHLGRNDAACLAWQMEAILRSDRFPRVAMRRDAERQATELFVYTPDAANIFARIAATLDRMNLGIQTANITSSTDGMAIEDILFLDDRGQPLMDEWTQIELGRQIEEVLSLPEDTPLKLATRRASPHLRHFDVPTVIVMDQACGGTCTRVQLETADRPGLLARVGLALAQSGLRLQGAVINTLGEKAIDTLFVSTLDHQPLDGPQRDELERRLRAALAHGAAA
ncbi:MAG: [protein-PII] uridylyltransferase [Halothiobacillaceae bacterium]|nr:MAG: [protein-PII] uridylyltransferase [Halothiobacillaceae bacterium]